MAGPFDVADALVNYMAGILYPNGTGQSSAINDPGGNPIAFKIYKGFPTTSLDPDMMSGIGSNPGQTIAHVRVYPLPAERNDSPLPGPWQVTSAPTPTLTLSASQIVGGYQVTVGGTISAGNVASINVNRVGTAYAVQASDTIDSVALALSALISGSSVAGSVITIPGAWRLTVGVAAPQTAIYGVKQQTKLYQIMVIVNNPTSRDGIIDFIDQMLGATYRLTLSDGSMCVLAYDRTLPRDDLQKENMWVSELHYRITYMTTKSQILTPVLNANPQITSSQT